MFELKTNVELLDENVVLGLFTYDFDAVLENYREIDFEFSKWGDPQNDNGQFVVQPYTTSGNIHRFDVDYAGTGGDDRTSHIWRWEPNAIDFESRYGAIPSPASGSIESWRYTGPDVPDEGDERVRLNLWLFGGAAPANAQDAEVVISDFRFVKAPTLPTLGAWGLLGLVLALTGSAFAVGGRSRSAKPSRSCTSRR
jgi:hypothetical protein